MALQCSIVCAQFVVFPLFLQLPAGVSMSFRAQQYARNSLDFLCFTMARGHFATFSYPTGCALTIGFSWFYSGPRAFLWHFHVQYYAAIHWIFFVLQWPARISLHFHVQLDVQQPFDFHCFTMARAHFVAFLCSII